MAEIVVMVICVTGGVVWLLIALSLLATLAFGMIPAIWRAACLTGYIAFGDAEEKKLRRLHAARRLHTEGES